MDIKSKADYYFEHVRGYLSSNLELFKLRIMEKSALAFSSLIAMIILLLVCFAFFLLLSMGLAKELSEYFESESLGYYCMALLYLIVGVVLIVFRRRLLIEPLMNFFIATVQDDFKPGDEHEQE